nr:hypothetical protein [Spirochaetia bacterium]
AWLRHPAFTFVLLHEEGVSVEALAPTDRSQDMAQGALGSRSWEVEEGVYAEVRPCLRPDGALAPRATNKVRGSKEAFQGYPVHFLAGTVAMDNEGIFKAIRNGKGTPELLKHGRKVYIRRG